MFLYNAVYTDEKPEMKADWYDPAWNGSEITELLSIRPESSSYIPRTRVKLLYCREGIAGIFTVDDNYMPCKFSNDMEQVWRDSCVEFFVRPYGSGGYFNFEFNCNGALHASYITDWKRTDNGFAEFVKFSAGDCASVERRSSFKKLTDTEIATPTEWSFQFFIPFKLIEKFCGTADIANEWECNFNKCADDSTHPHWVTWAPVKELNFHAPESFGKLAFII